MAERGITRAIPALILKDVMYASNAGAFACRPFGAVLRTFKFVPDKFVEQGPHQSSLSTRHKKTRVRRLFMSGGERGIRTLDTLPYTHFPGVLLQPLGHLS